MSGAFIENETVRLAFADGQWVDLKEELTQADSDYVMNQMAKAGHDGKTTSMEFNLGSLALMERMVVAWSFQNSAGPVAVNRESISRLRTKYRSLILERINELTVKAAEFSKN